MQYLPRREAAYEHPKHVSPPVRSVVMLAINYRTEEPCPVASPRQVNSPCPVTSPPSKEPQLHGDRHAHDHASQHANHEANDPAHVPANEHTNDVDERRPLFHANEPVVAGRVARYAWGTADYHDLLRDKLRLLSDFLHAQRPGCTTRGVVDTAPLLERDFARLAGLGWFGKNTMLLNKRAGSWLLLAGLLTDVELEADAPHETSHCGTCTRCLDVCPTQAFPEPYVLDARKCISYLTIELKGPIPQDLRDGVGEWLFGCDLCQDVCPWNRKAPQSVEPAFQPQPDLNPADCIAILRMSREQFQQRFDNTPLDRPGFDGLRRNAAIVLGNRGDAAAVPALIEALHDDAALVRGAAAWSLGKLSGDQARTALRDRWRVETDAGVREELQSAFADR